MQTIIYRLDTTSLALQCLRVHTPTAWCAGLIPGGTKILPAVQCSKKKTKGVNNKVLLYNTGNSVQYLV